MTKKLCGANKRSGGTCKNPGNGLNGKCKFHGGAAPPPGPGHPSWVTGRHSKLMKALPAHMRESFLTSVNDTEILSVRSELGLIDARVMELIERITTGESVEVVTEVMGRLMAIRREAQQPGADLAKLVKLASEGEELLRARLNDEKNWSDIRDTIESRRKLSDTERKLLEMKQAVVDSKQLQAILTLILQSVANNVLPLEGGRHAVDAVSGDIRRLMVN